jgi:hypothetical protein
MRWLMKTKRIALMALMPMALLLILQGNIVSAQDAEDCHLQGHILDKKDGAPVGGAIISMGSKMSVSFDDGYYNMTLPPGTYDVNITSPRYNTYTGVVNLTGNMTLDFELEKRPAGSSCQTTGLVMALPLAAVGLAVPARRLSGRKGQVG